jgi:hypothetical protein
VLKALREALADASKLFDAAQAKSAADDMRALGTVLSGPDDRPVSEAIRQLNDKLAEVKVTVRTKYLADLTSSLSDRESFAFHVLRMEKDKSMSKDDVEAVAFELMGGRKSWGTRKAAIAAIKAHFVEREYREAKLRNVDKAKVW